MKWGVSVGLGSKVYSPGRVETLSDASIDQLRFLDWVTSPQVLKQPCTRRVRVLEKGTNAMGASLALDIVGDIGSWLVKKHRKKVLADRMASWSFGTPEFRKMLGVLLSQHGWSLAE